MNCPKCNAAIPVEGKFCPSCGVNQIPEPAKSVIMPPKTIAGMRPKFFVILASSITVLLLFCLSFHVITDHLTIIPKEHLTFAETFVSVDEIVQKFNKADMFERLKIRESYLFQKLLEKGIINMKDQ